jgi:hypothetical protein
MFEEKHALASAAQPITDTSSHLYTLVIRPDNTWEVLVDLESKAKGTLLDDMEPPINPSKMIDDPTDVKVLPLLAYRAYFLRLSFFFFFFF